MNAITARSPLETDGTGLIDLDPWLEPHRGQLADRHRRYLDVLNTIGDTAGSLLEFAAGHHYFGFNRGARDGEQGVWYREWAPEAYQLFLTGDFNGWDREADAMHRDEFGTWHAFFPDARYADRLVHGSGLAVHVHSAIGPMDRVPAYARHVVQNADDHSFTARLWLPSEPFAWRHDRPPAPDAPLVYEAHVGMALEEPRLGTYAEFAELILPRIADAGYNTVQLMAVQEHPYYASFGYQVSSLFAPSSRFGTPDDLRRLVDTAHGMGLRVFIDLVHSHAVKNLYEGLNRFDGTEHQYFHAGPKGEHPDWGSLLYDYGKYEVRRFLLSNVRAWIEDFRFDGIRFDGVTSMLYHDHGRGDPFSSYSDYFARADEDAVIYLKLANEVAHAVYPDATTVAEDMSGMPGAARPVAEGGLGFDYRLAMGLPDYWIKSLRDKRDEDWHMGELYGAMVNRRHGEGHIGYCESHDQALVGDKTIAFWLMDADMYWHMGRSQPLNDNMRRGLALHKMIRLATFFLGGEGYLAFMGNEFGHPEWVDFPREGNDHSFHYARRQWSLADDPELRYADLLAFDRAMLGLQRERPFLHAGPPELLDVHEERKILVVQRAGLVAAFNFHVFETQRECAVGVHTDADHRVLLDTNAERFGGSGFVRDRFVYTARPGIDGRPASLALYLPARSAQVLVPVG